MQTRFFFRTGVAVAMAITIPACPSTEVVEGFPDEFVGVGLELTIQKKRPTVVRTIAGGPSEEAGIQKGDVITSIDGFDTTGMSLGAVVMLLRGKPNSQVVLEVSRKKKRIKVVMRRAALKKKGSGGYSAKP